MNRFGRPWGGLPDHGHVFDYLGAEKVTGKTGGNDLYGGKITLPLTTRCARLRRGAPRQWRI